MQAFDTFGFLQVIEAPPNNALQRPAQRLREDMRRWQRQQLRTRRRRAAAERYCYLVKEIRVMAGMDRLASIERRFSGSEYRVARDPPLPNNGTAKIVASRTYFSWKGLVIQSQHFIVCTLDNPTVSDMQDLFQSGFRIGKKRNRVPLIRGLQFGYMIIPVVIAGVVSDELRQHVSQQPPKHWGLIEFPVVCDAKSNDTFYFKGTPMWGAFFFSDLRDVVSRYID